MNKIYYEIIIHYLYRLILLNLYEFMINLIFKDIVSNIIRITNVMTTIIFDV